MRPAGSHIALFLPSLHGGGLERIMVSLANAFSAYGFAVDLVVGHADGPYRDSVSRGVGVIDLKKRRLLSCLPDLTRYLRRNIPTVLLSTPNQANVVAILASKAARVGTRVVVREATTLSLASRNARNRRGYLRPYYTALFYRLADQIIAISEGVADDLSACTGIDRSRISVIYNPIEFLGVVCDAAQPLEDPWFQAGQPPVILGAGRLTKAKDFSTLIRAFAHLRRCHETRLVILGEGEERPRLEALISELGIRSDVALPGFVRNPFAYMARARVFALSSAWEGFGNVLLEALACGTPVVSTNCASGPAEILGNGAYGLLTPVGDHVALAEALAQALASPPDRAKCQERVSAFSRRKIVEQYLAALKLGEPEPGREVGPTVHARSILLGGSLSRSDSEVLDRTRAST
jgi:glycosyltransferase involved in cell wall biosynthesis